MIWSASDPPNDLLGNTAGPPSAVLQAPLSRVGRIQRIFTTFARDPAEAITRVAIALHDFPERNRPIRPYIADPAWESELHQHFGLPTPCAVTADLAPLWDIVLGELRSQGTPSGPMAYLGWNDGDPGLIRAAWCLIRHLGANTVVETGVAHGLTSRFLLAALARNGGGHLWSIDFPPPLHPEVHHQIGIAVDPASRKNWTYVKGLSRRRLPEVLKRTGPIDLFVHDSLHTTSNVMFELSQAWAALRPGGAIIADDIDTNNGWHRFLDTVPHAFALNCEAEPIRPDERRVNQKGLFGIVIKPA